MTNIRLYKFTHFSSLFMAKKPNTLKETFGTFKFKRSTEEMMEEIDKESWDE